MNDLFTNPFFRIFFSPFDARRVMPEIWEGFGTNVQLMLYAEVIILLFALVLAVLRQLPGKRAGPIRWLVVGYCDFFRGTPLVLIAFVTTLGLPALAQGNSGGITHWIGSQSLLVYGVMALTIVYSAYVAEVYRAGIESVHPSQRMAARSLGLGYAQMMRHVILPQAIRRVIPPLLNDFIGLQKDTAIIGVVGVTEAVQQAQTYSTTFGNFSGYMVAAVLFVYITIPLARYTDGLINRREKLERAQA
jgi:polar amino acid transport system permease protein